MGNPRIFLFMTAAITAAATAVSAAATAVSTAGFGIRTANAFDALFLLPDNIPGR